MFDVRMTDELDEAGLAELRNAVIAFNVAATGYSDGTSLGCLVRDDDGQLVAGLDGFTQIGYAENTPAGHGELFLQKPLR